jgi:hypothetical protein
MAAAKDDPRAKVAPSQERERLPTSDRTRPASAIAARSEASSKPLGRSRRLITPSKATQARYVKNRSVRAATLP